MSNEFRETYIQAIIIILNVEENSDVLALVLGIAREVVSCSEKPLEDDLGYLLIDNVHMKLYSSHFGVKKCALGLIMTLAKNKNSDFIFVFKNMVERCLESQNHDFVLIFLETLSSIEDIPYSDEIYKVMLDVVMSPLFSSTKETILYVLTFIENLFLANHSISKGISRTLFVYFCKHMRSLHAEVREKSVKVFSHMDLRKVDQELLLLSIKKEKF